MTITPDLYLPVLIGLIVGLLLGWIIWGRVARERRALRDSMVVHERARIDAVADRDRLASELTATREQLRPLADEVDRLKRDLARRPALAVVAGTTLQASAAPVMPAPDDVRVLKGVGDKFAARLEALGYGRIATLAALDDAAVAHLDAQVAPFEGRLVRDRIVEQAQLLNQGRIAEYEARFGKLGAV